MSKNEVKTDRIDKRDLKKDKKRIKIKEFMAMIYTTVFIIHMCIYYSDMLKCQRQHLCCNYLLN